jgi:hypothetical protein
MSNVENGLLVLFSIRKSLAMKKFFLQSWALQEEMIS